MIKGENILVIGCNYIPPTGGVASVLSVYDKYIYDKMKFVANSCDGSFVKKLWTLFTSYIKCEQIERHDRDIRIVHIHTASYHSFKRSTLYLKQAKRNGKKAILHIHGGGFREYRQTCPGFVDKYLQMCDVVIALSETWKSFFTEKVGLQNVYVVNNIIENPQICPKKYDGKFHLFFLGLITEAKGIFDLLETIHKHKEEWKNRIVLHIGGDGKIEQMVQRIEDLDISELVKYEGWVSGDKKSMLFNNADAFILPSYIEGFPISILEAMSYGLPILSTPVGGIPEIVNDDENGALFQPGDKKSMYKAIDMLLNNSEKCFDMGRRSQILSKSFLPSNIEMQLVNIYNSLDCTK